MRISRFLHIQFALISLFWSCDGGNLLSSNEKPKVDRAGDMVLDPGGNLLWYNQPSGLYYNGNSYFGWLDNERNVKVCSFNEQTGKFSEVRTIKRWHYLDDHGMPVLHVLKQGKYKGHILIFLNLHNSALTYIRSKRPEDVSEFTEEILIDSTQITYPSILESSSGDLILFYQKIVNGTGKNVSRSLFCRYSFDSGETWTRGNELVAFGEQTRVYYVSPEIRNDSIHLAYSIEEASGRVVDVHYMRSPNFGLNWETATGDKISFPWKNGNPFFRSSNPGETRVWDIELDSSGQPWIAFVSYDSIVSKNDSITTKNYVAELNKGAWHIYFAGNGRNSYYPGGLALDPRDPKSIITSEPGRDGKLAIVEKKLNRSKNSYDFVATISRNTENNQVRPQFVDGYSSIRTMWVESINYINYQDYHTNLKLEILSQPARDKN